MRGYRVVILVFLLVLPLVVHAKDDPFRLWLQPDTDDFATVKNDVEQYFAGKFTGRGSGYKQFQRWAHIMRSSLSEEGKIVNRVAKTWEEYGRYLEQVPWSRVTYGDWYSIGPTGWTNGNSGYNPGIGRINVVAVHPTTPTTIFVGSPAGGLWRSTDAGVSWTNLTDGMPVIGVSGIAIDYTNPDIIYILTGDGDAADTFSIGVLRTTDGGQTWLRTGLQWHVTDYVRGFKLRIHPTMPNVLFVVANYGLYRTTDSGATWTRVADGMYDIEFRPFSPWIMYASRSTGFYRSTDSGVTWGQVLDPDLPTGGGRIEIGVTPANSDYVYLLAGPATAKNEFRGLFRSVDGGLDFSRRSNNPNILGSAKDGNDDKDQNTYDLAIAVDPDDPEIVYCGGINIWKSTDGGSTWSIRSMWDEPDEPDYTHADIHDLVFYDTTLYCGSDGGVFFSVDRAVSFTDLSAGLVITQFYRIGGTDSTPNLIYGGTQDNGSNKWSPGSFIHVKGGDGFEAAIDYTDSSTVWVEQQNGNLFRSTDGGSTWSSRMPDGEEGDWCTPYHLHPTDPTAIYGGWEHVYRSKSSGLLWNNIDDGIPGKTIAMAHGVSNTDRLYAAGETDIKRTDNAWDLTPDWTGINGTLPLSLVRPVTYLAVDPNDSFDVVVTLGGYTPGIKVFMTSDRGATWTNISGSLPNIPVRCAVFDPNRLDHSLYIGTDVGVFYRDDSLADWIPFRNGLPHVIVKEMEIRHNQLTAATYGRGLWRSALFTSCQPSLVLTQANDPSNPLYTGFQYYEASNNIGSSRIITGGVGTDVTYQAGNFVKMSTGFHARGDNLFKARIGSCSAKGTWTPRRLPGDNLLYGNTAVDTDILPWLTGPQQPRENGDLREKMEKSQ